MLRYIAKFKDGARQPPVAQLYYENTDEGNQKAEAFVRREDKKGYSIYSCIGLLRCMPRNKENVGELPCIVLDIDLRSVEEARERVLECLRGLVLPPSANQGPRPMVRHILQMRNILIPAPSMSMRA